MRTGAQTQSRHLIHLPPRLLLLHALAEALQALAGFTRADFIAGLPAHAVLILRAHADRAPLFHLMEEAAGTTPHLGWSGPEDAHTVW